jgi:uncharacterized RDD family membrane protein YckC
MSIETHGMAGFTDATSNSFEEKCFLCGLGLSRDMMVQFGDKWVCAQCKPNYLQMLQQGLSTSGQKRYGGFWIRVGARIIDSIILQVFNYILLIAIFLGFSIEASVNNPGPLVAMTLLQVGVSLVISLSYEVWFVGKFRATPGKMLCGLVIVRSDGGKVSYMRVLGRQFATVLSALILGIGYIMAGFDSEKRALHDRICDTRVIRK